MKKWLLTGLPIILAALAGCTTVNVNEMRLAETEIDPSVEKIVVLGRHHSPEFETEPDLVQCIGKRLESGIDGLDVLSAPQFRDALFPWFEPRTAPLQLDKFGTILDEPLIRDALADMGVRYIIWITGSTEQISSAGSMACAISPAGGGCFGFGTWENESEYEAVIWDFTNLTESGRISTDARGVSYMPAIVIPIPMIARVQSNACAGMGNQILGFLTPVSASR